jgi:hypothetical protein
MKVPLLIREKRQGYCTLEWQLVRYTSLYIILVMNERIGMLEPASPLFTSIAGSGQPMPPVEEKKMEQVIHTRHDYIFLRPSQHRRAAFQNLGKGVGSTYGTRLLEQTRAADG